MFHASVMSGALVPHPAFVDLSPAGMGCANCGVMGSGLGLLAGRAARKPAPKKPAARPTRPVMAAPKVAVAGRVAPTATPAVKDAIKKSGGAFRLVQVGGGKGKAGPIAIQSAVKPTSKQSMSPKQATKVVVRSGNVSVAAPPAMPASRPQVIRTPDVELDPYSDPAAYDEGGGEDYAEPSYDGGGGDYGPPYYDGGYADDAGYTDEPAYADDGYEYAAASEPAYTDEADEWGYEEEALEGLGALPPGCSIDANGRVRCGGEMDLVPAYAGGGESIAMVESGGLISLWGGNGDDALYGWEDEDTLGSFWDKIKEGIGKVTGAIGAINPVVGAIGGAISAIGGKKEKKAVEQPAGPNTIPPTPAGPPAPPPATPVQVTRAGRGGGDGSALLPLLLIGGLLLALKRR